MYEILFCVVAIVGVVMLIYILRPTKKIPFVMEARVVRVIRRMLCDSDSPTMEYSEVLCCDGTLDLGDIPFNHCMVLEGDRDIEVGKTYKFTIGPPRHILKYEIS